MKILYEFIPKLNFVEAAEKVVDLIDGFNITDSASGIPAPSGTACACVLKNKYPDKMTIPMLISNYKGPIELGAAALAAEAMGVDGLLPDPGDAPKYGNLIQTKADGSCEMISDPDAILEYRRSTGPAEGVRDYLRENVKIEKTQLGCLLTARVPAEAAIERIKDAWDFGFFLRLEESTVPKLKEIGAECKKLGKPLYPYLVVSTPKNQKILDRIGWPASANMDNVEDMVKELEGHVTGVIATCLGFVSSDIELLNKLQPYRG